MKQIDLEGKIFGYNKKMLAVLAATVLLFGIAFYVGAKYEKNKLFNLGLLKDCKKTDSVLKKKSKSNPVMNTSQAVESVSGNLTARDSKGSSITIKTGNNLSMVVTVTASTTIGRDGTEKLSDLLVGAKVNVSGFKNSDGSLVANNIQPIEMTK